MLMSLHARTPKLKKRLWREISGWGLIVLGLAGCMLPVAPGIPFLLGGLALLAQDYVWAQRTMEKLKEWWESAKARAKR